MTLDEMKLELEKIIADENSQLGLLDNSMREVIEVMKKVSPNWIESEIKHAITRNPEEFSKLPTERIKEFKGDVNSLVSNIPQLVDKEMSDKNQWPHYVMIDPKYIIPEYYSDRKDNDYIDKKLRGILSEVGSILSKYGLIIHSSKYVNSWEFTGQGKFKYAYGLSLDESVTVVFKKYYSGMETLFNLEKNKRDISRKIKEQEALELWNKV